MTVVGVDDDRSKMTGDAEQAAYFRHTLSEEREHIATQLTNHREELSRRLAASSISGTGHLKSQVRSLEAEQRYLDGLIANLDRRFAAFGVARGHVFGASHSDTCGMGGRPTVR